MIKPRVEQANVKTLNALALRRFAPNHPNAIALIQVLVAGKSLANVYRLSDVNAVLAVVQEVDACPRPHPLYCFDAKLRSGRWRKKHL
jgi:hypothetical protein